MNEPTPEFQLQFLERFQRLLESGGFVATYKYALLIALCNVAAEAGFDDNREQRVEIRRLGEQFLGLYWTHARPYPGLTEPLRQNTGRQAAILSTVAKARASLANPDRVDAPQSAGEAYVREATQRVKTMPLWKLQTIGAEKSDPDHPDNFLYPTRDEDGSIVLRPGISACLRRFRSLVVSSTQAAWTEYVRRTNPLLGAGHDLERFLFGSDRAAVHQLASGLLELQAGRCFYTQRPLTPGDAHVDHFIPWAKYPTNSPFNLVVASNSANLQKSDHIAAIPHLRRWRERNHDHHHELVDLGALGSDQTRVSHIARFTYSQADRVKALGWLRGREMTDLAGWQDIIPA
jgi:5-methylcytosine-specific restriction endonuclease McrA